MRAADLWVFEGNWPGTHQAEKLSMMRGKSVINASLRASAATRPSSRGHSRRPSWNPPLSMVPASPHQTFTLGSPFTSSSNHQKALQEWRVCALESKDLTFAV